MQLRICAMVRFVVLAEDLQGAVLELEGLRRQFDGLRLRDGVSLAARRVAKRAPRRHAAAFADARVRVEARRNREFAGARASSRSARRMAGSPWARVSTPPLVGGQRHAFMASISLNDLRPKNQARATAA